MAPTRAHRSGIRRPAFGRAGTTGIVLLVEDDAVVSRVWRRALEAKGYEVHSAKTSAEGLEKAAAYANGPPLRLALIDDSLPDGWGLDVVPILAALVPPPAVALVSCRATTARWTDAARRGVAIVPKPDNVTDLHALLELLEAHWKASTTPALEPLVAGSRQLTLYDDGIVTPEGWIRLPATNCDLLAYLIENEGVAVPVTALAHLFRERDDLAAARLFQKHMSNLRRALGPWRGLIQTLPGLGYRLRRSWFRRERGSKAARSGPPLPKVAKSGGPLS